MKHYFFLVLIVSVLFSCKKDLPPIDGTVFQRSHISSYVSLEEDTWSGAGFYQKITDYYQADGPADKITWEFTLDKGRYHSQGSSLHEEMSQKYNDLSYNQYVVPFSYMALKDTLVTVTVVANGGYGPEFPDGALLNKYAEMEYTTRSEYIKAGYQAETTNFPDYYWGGTLGLTYHKRSVHELYMNSNEDIDLINPRQLRISLDKAVPIVPDQSIEVILVFSNGKRARGQFVYK